VDLLAPGQGIRSSITGGVFGDKSGTSMSAPHVAGAFAVIRGRRATATVDQIETALRNTGVPIVVPGTSPSLTIRRINVEAALATFGTNPGTFVTRALTVPQTYTMDFDAGAVGGPAGNVDLWFQAETATALFLTPRNGAQIWVGDRSNRNYEGCSTGAYTTSRVSLSAVPVGSYVCMRTNQGRISQFRMNAISSGSPRTLSIGFTTWNLG
jgi:hypothetical protein